MAGIKPVVRVLFVTLALGLYSNLGYSAPQSGNPCQSSSLTKLSVPIDNGAVGPHELNLASNQSIHACGFTVSGPGCGLFQIEYSPLCSAVLQRSHLYPTTMADMP
jgi:hypothetical protein